jgi:hypothetical protein
MGDRHDSEERVIRHIYAIFAVFWLVTMLTFTTYVADLFGPPDSGSQIIGWYLASLVGFGAMMTSTWPVMFGISRVYLGVRLLWRRYRQ